MKLDSPVNSLTGVGERLAQRLSILGINSVGDLITHYPRRYEDYSAVVSINRLHPGPVTLKAAIGQIASRYVRRGLHITEAIASDGTGSVRLIWFNQPYRAGSIKPGKSYYIAGEYGLRRGRFSILNPSVELTSAFPVNTARIIPIYRETKGLKSATIRKLIREALLAIDKLPEHLPDWLIANQKLVTYSQAVRQMHFPSSPQALKQAKRRLGFEEVFELSLAALINKRQNAREEAVAIPFKPDLARNFVAQLPFKLTNAQRKVVWRIYQDMAKTEPMNRLVEGDVGSGKTVTAAMAALMVMEQGFQAAFMAPTEILARQHAATLYELLHSVGRGQRVGLLIGAFKPAQKRLAHQRIASGDIGLIVGTHALIAEKVDMHKLGLIIIDEQHRFGVQQRKRLQAKAGHMPHVLHMTATPIPRSLALTLYGELDISVLDELPAGRQKIVTEIVSPNAKTRLYRRIDQELEAGRQMFVVCPLITDSETSGGLAAEEVYERLRQSDFKHRRVGLLHGKLKSSHKNLVMQKFLNGELDILVSTTVVEVGVDVPNASIMLIEGAERFGLAQIHQLRGRVGRGRHQSYCYLIPSTSADPGPRLTALETTTDGFELADLDLRLRGPGAIYGDIQHGALDLRVAELSDSRLIAAARKAAQDFIERGDDVKKYPHLSARIMALRAVTNLN